MMGTAYKEESRFFATLLLTIYGLNSRSVRKLLRMIMVRRKGAELYSRTLRIIFSRYHGVDVGMYSYGWFGPTFPPGTTVGRYCSLAKGLQVINGSHPVSCKSTHPFFYNPDLGYVDSLLIKRRTELSIGNDVYMGSNVTILPSVTSIGDGSVIAAGSVVIKDVPPFAIVGGNPAKLIRYRFSPKTVEKVMKSAWWEKDIKELKANNQEFSRFLKPLESPEAGVDPGRGAFPASQT